MYVFIYLFSSAVHELEFFFKTCEKSRGVRVHGNCHVGQGANVSERACGCGENFFLLYNIYSSCVRACISVHACRGGYFEMFDTLGGHFGVFDSQRHFPSYFSSFFSVLALGTTVILRVYSCLDLGPETGRLQHV